MLLYLLNILGHKKVSTLLRLIYSIWANYLLDSFTLFELVTWSLFTILYPIMAMAITQLTTNTIIKILSVFIVVNLYLLQTLKILLVVYV
jgi:hypothetical protein